MNNIPYETMDAELILPMLMACIFRGMNLPDFKMTTKTYDVLKQILNEDKSTTEDIVEFMRKNRKAAELVRKFYTESIKLR